MKQQLQIEGIDVLVEGEGQETIVMLHGWPDTYRLWDAQVAALSPHYRCVRFTLPGFDCSKPRRAWSLAEMLALFERIVTQVSPGRKVTLMLHDWGCVFGYQFYMHHPELVSRIVGVDIGDVESRDYVKSLSLGAKLMVVWYQVWLAVAWKVGGRMGDWMTHFMVRLMKVPADPRYISSAMNFPYYITWTGAHGSYRDRKRFEPACPMLFIYGSKKPFMFHSRPWAEALDARPSSRVLGFKADHWPMVRQPEAFNEGVAAWLGETAVAAAAPAVRAN